MVRRTARKGANAGREFWGCSRYRIDECPGTIDIPSTDNPPPAVTTGSAGVFSQAKAEQIRRDRKRRLRVVLPMVVALVCLLALGSYLGFAPYLGLSAGVPSLMICLVGMFLILKLPSEAIYWDKGATGERRTAEVLRPLESQGFVIWHGRLMPDGHGDIDSIAIGPTGVWVIETKNLSGSVEVVNDRLFVKDHDRQAMVAQVYREAFIVQQIVGELLGPANTMVVPVLCIHGARTPRFDRTVGGVRIASGGHLVSLMTTGPQKLDPELVQKVAELADRKLREPWPWEDGR